jgi:hypothetical protein
MYYTSPISKYCRLFYLLKHERDSNRFIWSNFKFTTQADNTFLLNIVQLQAIALLCHVHSTSVHLRVKPNERNFTSCESRIFCHSLTSSQLILRRRVVQTAFLYKNRMQQKLHYRNYATHNS